MPDRRDFLKGIIATLAAVPAIALARELKPEPLIEESGPSALEPRCGGLQSHGEQPEFFINEWSAEHEMTSRHEQRVYIRATLYTEDPRALSHWVQRQPLVLDLPDFRRVRVRVREWSAIVPGRNEDILVEIEGVECA